MPLTNTNRSTERIDQGKCISHQIESDVHENSTVEVDVRESLRILPNWTQCFITWGCGKPLSDAQPPKWMQSNQWKVFAPYYFFLSKVLGYCFGLLGVITVIYAVSSGASWLYVLLVPIFYILFVNSARGLQVETIHQTVHEQNTGNVKIDCIIGEISSAIAFCNCPSRYGQAHVPIHHGTELCSMSDHDVQFMYSILGIEPGMSADEILRRLLKALVSVRVHTLFLRARFKGVFSSEEKKIHDDANVHYWPKGLDLTFALHVAQCRKLIAISIYFFTPAISILLAAMYGTFLPLITVFLGLYLPAIWLYQISAILHFSGEHYWKFRQIREEGVPYRTVMVRMTSGRFYGDAAPCFRNDTKIITHLKWMKWWLKFILVHVPLRHFVSPSSLPWHDAHHTRPRGRDWVLGPYWRCEHITSGADTYTENWSLNKQLTAVFESISELPAFSTEERAQADAVCNGEQTIDTFLSM